MRARPDFLRESPDPLSAVFDLVELRGQLSGSFSARGHWLAREQGIRSALKLTCLVRGRGTLRVNGVKPIELAPGDIAILNNRSTLELECGKHRGPLRVIAPELHHATNPVPDDPEVDVVVGGHVDLDARGRDLLRHALPPVGIVRGTDPTAANVCAIIGRLIAEVTSPRAGSRFAIKQYGQLLVLEVLRAYIDQSELPAGWLRMLVDERLGPAVREMHDHPGKPWSLDKLAHAAAMSRSTFAERFHKVAGVPPLAYLSNLRMMLAQRALRDRDVRVGTLAAELGYASESAFSTAFKRETGESPLRYRRGAAATAPAR